MSEQQEVKGPGPRYTVHVYLPPPLLEKLRAQAARERRTISNLGQLHLEQTLEARQFGEAA